MLPSDSLPPALAPLAALAHDLWWSWDPDTSALFAGIDPLRWEACRHNPVALLRDLDATTAERLSTDAAFLERAAACHARWQAWHATRAWCADAAPALLRTGVAYVSMEYGLHESLRLYSGGLGVLAGDHLKSASDLGVPLVAVGIFWHQGYFRQILDDGVQVPCYPTARLDRLPITPVHTPDGAALEITVPLGDREVRARVRALQVGRVRLLLLDTHVEGATDEDRALCGQLYGGDETLRIRQEVLLGFGAVRALRALGVAIGVWHLNEGHCGFVPLALRETLSAEEVRARCVFTTHTPVEAGHDRFPAALVAETLGRWADEVKLDRDAVVDLGRVRPGDAGESFCMTVIALRSAASANAVSRLHGEVSREMWRGLHPDRPVAEVPIGHVTNGVHAGTWIAPELAALYDRHLSGWRHAEWSEDAWRPALGLPDAPLWAARAALRAQLCDAVRARTGHAFDPEALTIGFARRFAPYKRGDLLFRDPARLLRLLADHPIQIVWAGKAHPRDLGGQRILAEVARMAADPRFRGRLVLLEDYDLALGRLLVRGCDVWLNTPRRPYEASGTSGQKVVLNGGLHLSILDGWWAEAWDGANGWSIGAPDAPIVPEGDGAAEAARDAEDAADLYGRLEGEVAREWSQRDAGLPRAWLARVKRSIATHGPRYTSHRMVRDYVLGTYLPRVS